MPSALRGAGYPKSDQRMGGFINLVMTRGRG